MHTGVLGLAGAAGMPLLCVPLGSSAFCPCWPMRRASAGNKINPNDCQHSAVQAVCRSLRWSGGTSFTPRTASCMQMTVSSLGVRQANMGGTSRWWTGGQAKWQIGLCRALALGLTKTQLFFPPYRQPALL